MRGIKGIAGVKLFPGKLAERKRLTKQAMEIVRTKDAGTCIGGRACDTRYQRR